MLSALRPRTILESGVGDGGNTRLLAEFAATTGGRLHSVDPFPRVDVDGLVKEFHPHLSFYAARSLRVIDLIGPIDVAIIDGDHNWYTVYEELRAVQRVSLERGRPTPVSILHDVGWPYGRRDAYMDHELPPEHRHPWSVGGLFPRRGVPVDANGLNWNVAHANHEGGPRNGVRTAVEDHVAASSEPLRVVIDPYNWGVAVIVPATRLAADPELNDVVDHLQSTLTTPQRDALERERVETLMSSYPSAAPPGA